MFINCSIEYMYSEVQYPACLICFLSHSVAFAAWSRIQHVELQMIYFNLFFFHLARRSHYDHPFFFRLGS